MATPKQVIYSIEEDKEVLEVNSKSGDQFFCIKDVALGTEMWIDRIHIDTLREILCEIKRTHHGDN